MLFLPLQWHPEDACLVFCSSRLIKWQRRNGRAETYGSVNVYVNLVKSLYFK